MRSLFSELDELDYPDPPNSGGVTSIAAAEAIKPTVSTLRENVFGFIHSCGVLGATREEIESALGMTGNTVRPRVWELIKASRVIASKATRKTNSGRQAEVLLSCSVEKPQAKH